MGVVVADPHLEYPPPNLNDADGAKLPTTNGSIQTCGDSFPVDYVFASRDEDELVANLVWRVKLVAELPTGVTREMEIACLERDEQAGLADCAFRRLQPSIPIETSHLFQTKPAGHSDDPSRITMRVASG